MQINNICFFVSSLSSGGAERQVVTTAIALKKMDIKTSVVVYYNEAFYDHELKEAGVEIHYIRKKQGIIHLPAALIRLAKVFNSLKPSVIYSFLDMSNIFNVLLKPFHHTKAVWGVLASNMDMKQYGLIASFGDKLEVRLSCFADLIICNSHAGKEFYVKKGFPADKTIVIETGIDTDRFNYDPAGAKKIREEFAIKRDEKIILLAARLNIMKDHKNFIAAAAILAKKNSKLKFICVGYGNQKYRDELIDYANSLGIKDRVIFTGVRNDVVAFYSSAASSVSSSAFGEGLSNTIAESMSCGTICAVTAVGDSALIVGDLGFIAPPKNAEKLAEAIENSLNSSIEREKLRSSIIDRFSVQKMIDRTLEAVTAESRNDEKG